MGNNIQFGINKEEFEIIKQIDILWLKKNTIISAYKVERSTIINNGVNRFRNLFTEIPNLNIKVYIVIPEKRESEAKKKINSPANIKEGISDKIKIIMFSEVMGN